MEPEIGAMTADETSIRSLYRRMVEGWNRGSGADFAAPFAENSRFIAFDGTCFQGRDEIAVTHQRLFDTHLKGTLLTARSWIFGFSERTWRCCMRPETP